MVLTSLQSKKIQILRGLAIPEDCKLFRKACNPLHPIGACMVSKEGTCNIAHRYSRG